VRPRASSSKATSSTGGIPRPAAGCGRASPTICIWLAFADAQYLEATGDRDPRRERPLPRRTGARRRGTSADGVLRARVGARAATLFEHAARALDRSLAVGQHGLPLIGTGDWNDGMNRVGAEGARRERLARLVPDRHARATSRRSRHARGDATRARRVARPCRGSRRSPSRRRPGTANGTGAPTTTTARRWARPRNDECRIDAIAQSWAVLSGAGDPGAGARAMASVDELPRRRDDGLMLLFTPPFDRAARAPATSRATRPAFARTAGSTPTRRSGPSMAFAALGRRRRGRRALRAHQPDQPRADPRCVRATRSSPTSSRPTSTAPAHVGRGGWTWYTGSAGWLYRAGLESILGVCVRGDHLHLDPCIPRAWPAYRITYRHGAARYEIRVENPRGVCRGVTSVELDGKPMLEAGARIPLVDDGGDPSGARRARLRRPSSIPTSAPRRRAARAVATE
jgi:cyclic beta-1,2-glucan synthetase